MNSAAVFSLLECFDEKHRQLGGRSLLEFDTTRCVIQLFEHGTEFVSRSEAKRLLANLERFREVVLDFHGVRTVGQGFVDEVFRVWARKHPDVRLVPEGMNATVGFMVRRGLARTEEERARRPPGTARE